MLKGACCSSLSRTYSLPALAVVLTERHVAKPSMNYGNELARIHGAPMSSTITPIVSIHYLVPVQSKEICYRCIDAPGARRWITSNRRAADVTVEKIAENEMYLAPESSCWPWNKAFSLDTHRDGAKVEKSKSHCCNMDCKQHL